MATPKVRLFNCPPPVRVASHRDPLQIRARSPRLSLPARIHGPPVIATSSPVLLGSVSPPRWDARAHQAALQHALHESQETLCAQARRAGAAEALLREREAKLAEVSQQVREALTRDTSKESQPSLRSRSASSSVSVGSELPPDAHCQKSVRERLTEMLITAECEAAKARRGEAEQRCRAATSAQEVEQLHSKLGTQDKRCVELQAEISALTAKLGSSERAQAEAQEQLQHVVAERDQLALELAQNTSSTAALREEMASLKDEVSVLRRQLSEKTLALKHTTARADRAAQEQRNMEVALKSYKEYHGINDNHLLQKVANLEVSVHQLAEQVDAANVQLGAEHGSAVELQRKNASLERQLLHAELTRLEMHNAIQELKGNIRVFCRVRPAEVNAASALHIVDQNSLSLSHGEDCHSFAFDKIFGPRATQSEVFEEVDGLVQSALDGYKVCIFAYGQTGSGKTYTMQGSDGSSCAGLVPRALRKIFCMSSEMQSRGWLWSLHVSIMEVYNESLRDLLRNNGNGDSAAGPTDRHVIVQSDTWGTMVGGMSCIKVESHEQIVALMARASKQRSCAATEMNNDSSRSHLVTALYIKGTNASSNTELCGALHLVDLAGSERLEKSGSTGDRLKETRNINKSLSCLAHVFAAKAEGRAHVPFRNSKLTHLMEPCLSGHGKTLMFVNVQPEERSAHESLCSLRFARQVSQCNTGGRTRRSVRPASTAAKPHTPVKTAPRSQSPRSKSPAGQQRSQRFIRQPSDVAEQMLNGSHRRRASPRAWSHDGRRGAHKS